MNRFIDQGIPSPSAARDELAALREALAQCQVADEESTGVAEQVERLTAWCEPSFERRYDRPEMRAADLRQLQITAQGYSSRSRFLAELTLEPPASTGDLADEPHLDDDYTTLSTIHSAKGGEWDVVHLIHGTDGNFPADMALSSPNGLEEERRLMYVALTRARDGLNIYAPLRYHHSRSTNGARFSFAPLSRFLSPIRHLMDEATDEMAEQDAESPLGSKITVADEVDAITNSLWTL